MDGLEKAFFIDSATIALEAFDTITNTINLKETDGFAIFEAYNNIERKLALTDNMADAISKAESLAKSMKGKKIAFSFTFKKSIYHPAKSEYTDMIERDLIFHQVCIYALYLPNAPRYTMTLWRAEFQVLIWN